jgi:hypothetical protein
MADTAQRKRPRLPFLSTETYPRSYTPAYEAEIRRKGGEGWEPSSVRRNVDKPYNVNFGEQNIADEFDEQMEAQRKKHVIPRGRR